MKILPKYTVPVLSDQLQLDLEVFEFASNFTEVVSVIYNNIPLGLPREDKDYQEEQAERLFICLNEVT
jgi:hypothetical protein